MNLLVYVGKRKHWAIAQSNWNYYLGNRVRFHGVPHIVKAVGREGFQPVVHLKRA